MVLVRSRVDIKLVRSRILFYINPWFVSQDGSQPETQPNNLALSISVRLSSEIQYWNLDSLIHAALWLPKSPYLDDGWPSFGR